MNGLKEGRSDPGIRCRLRLILGMHILDRLARDPATVGTSIPSIRSIALATGVHRNTVASVVADLRGFGLLECVVGSGCVVSRPSWTPGASPLVCPEPELAGLLTFELGAPVSAHVLPSPGGAALLPLDSRPPPTGPCIPLAPRGATLAALRALSPGTTAMIVSRSALVRRLMTRSIRAIHGCCVSVITIETHPPEPHSIHPSAGSLSTAVFHDPDCPVDGGMATACPLQIAPANAVDTG